MAEPVLAEIEFNTHDSPFTVTLSPVPMRDYLAFRRDWSTPGSLDDFEASVAGFERIASASCACGDPLTAHDIGTVRALATVWIERVMEVDPPLPVGSSGRTPSPEASTSTAPRSSRRRS